MVNVIRVTMLALLCSSSVTSFAQGAAFRPGTYLLSMTPQKVNNALASGKEAATITYAVLITGNGDQLTITASSKSGGGAGRKTLSGNLRNNQFKVHVDSQGSLDLQGLLRNSADSSIDGAFNMKSPDGVLVSGIFKLALISETNQRQKETGSNGNRLWAWLDAMLL